MKYKMIDVQKFWKEWHKGLHRTDMNSKTLVLVERDGELFHDFAYIMQGFFDHHRQGGSFTKDSIKFVLVKIEKK